MARMRRDLLISAHAYFGGGTAIVMELGGEYRESVDIDFLCNIDQPGWKELRQAFFQDQFRALFPNGDVEETGEFVSDQYGIRGWVSIDGERDVKVEIIAEGRIPISGELNHDLGVLQLDRPSMFAEKLCANVDRMADSSSYMRDILDIIMMEIKWEPIPKEAFEIASGHYGNIARVAFNQAMEKISSRRCLDECCKQLQIPDEYRDQIIDHLGDRFRDDFMEGFLP